MRQKENLNASKSTKLKFYHEHLETGMTLHTFSFFTLKKKY